MQKCNIDRTINTIKNVITTLHSLNFHTTRPVFTVRLTPAEMSLHTKTHNHNTHLMHGYRCPHLTTLLKKISNHFDLPLASAAAFYCSVSINHLHLNTTLPHTRGMWSLIFCRVKDSFGTDTRFPGSPSRSLWQLHLEENCVKTCWKWVYKPDKTIQCTDCFLFIWIAGEYQHVYVFLWCATKCVIDVLKGNICIFESCYKCSS